jgi:hypothetical protein
MKKKVLKELELLKNDSLKSQVQLQSEKEKIIKELKKLTREDILPKPPEPPKKITLWERIQKVLMGL